MYSNFSLDSHALSSSFVSSACWIQGVYIYKELRYVQNVVAYFGIPKDMNLNGLLPGSTPNNTKLCKVNSEYDISGNKENQYCVPMTKIFYLQYQWMPFFVASLATCYYVPYILLRMANNDLVGLKDTIKADDVDAKIVAKHYFDKQSCGTDAICMLTNILIKLLYIGANIGSGLSLNILLNDEFLWYGKYWIKWSRLDNSIAYDYMGMRDHPKPGNLLVPPFGYCEMFESAKDIKQTLNNKHTFVCELSQNVLYQYCLIVIWFSIVVGIIISVLGFLLLLLCYMNEICRFMARKIAGKRVHKVLTFREFEYLEFISKRNVILYHNVLEEIRE